MTDCHTNRNRSWDTNWYTFWIQNKLMGGHNSWSRNWPNDWVRNKLTTYSIESVGQAVGDRSGKRVQTNHVWNRHGSVQDSGAGNASSNTRVQMSLGRGSGSTVLDRRASQLCGTRADVCSCPKIQKANSRLLNLDKQRCGGL